MTESTATEVVAATDKPGWRTTEFWMSAVGKVVGILFAVGVLGDGSAESRAAGLALAGLTSIGYSVSRGLAKG